MSGLASLLARMDRARSELERIPPLLKASGAYPQVQLIAERAAAELEFIAHELAREPALKPTVALVETAMARAMREAVEQARR